MKTFGIALLVIGIIMTAFTGFTLITSKKVADIGPIKIEKKERTPIYWSPITGAVLVGAGLIMVIYSRKRE